METKTNETNKIGSKQRPAVGSTDWLDVRDKTKPTLDGEPVRIIGFMEHPYDHKTYFVVERIRDFALIGLR